jgi:hypothetical protein
MVVMESSVLWHMTTCSLLKANRRLHLQDRRVGQETTVKAGGKLGSFFEPEDGSVMSIQNIS